MENLYVIYNSVDGGIPVMLYNCLHVKKSIAANLMSARPSNKYVRRIEDFYENYEKISGREYVPGSARCVGYQEPVCYIANEANELGYHSDILSEEGLPCFFISDLEEQLVRNRIEFEFLVGFSESSPNGNRKIHPAAISLHYTANADQINVILQNYPDFFPDSCGEAIADATEALAYLSGHKCLRNYPVAAYVLMDGVDATEVWG